MAFDPNTNPADPEALLLAPVLLLESDVSFEKSGKLEATEPNEGWLVGVATDPKID